MIRNTIGFAVGVSLLALSVSARAADPAQCLSYHSEMLQKDVGYCIQRSRPELPQAPGEPVVYFMHGIYGSAHSWIDNGYAEALQILGAEEKFPRFTAISFDTNGTSFFSDPVSVHRGADSFETWLIAEFMPKMETELNLCRERKCRLVAGISMGGFGALKTALRYSGLFAAAAANSPALPPFNIQESESRWIDYFNRHEVGALKGMYLLAGVRQIFTTREYADQNDPSWLAGDFKDLSALPAIYLDVGGKDYYGFDEGYWRFRKAMESRGVQLAGTFIPDGTHDVAWDRRWWLIRFLRDQLRVRGSAPARLDRSAEAGDRPGR